MTPDTWFVAFFTVTPYPWLQRLVIGKYKHVLCFGYIPGTDCWIFVEPAITGSEITVRPEEEATSVVDTILDLADVLVVPKAHEQPPLWSFGLGWCVPTVARIIGRGHSALRPDAFWRRLRPHAIEVFLHEDERAEAEAGPGTEGPAGSGQGREAADAPGGGLAGHDRAHAAVRH